MAGALMIISGAAAQKPHNRKHDRRHDNRTVVVDAAGCSSKTEVCGVCGMKHGKGMEAGHHMGDMDMHDMMHREVVKVVSAESARLGETISFDFYINYDKLLIEKNEEYVITPYLVKGDNSLRMRPVVFVGEKCYNRQKRHNTLYGEGRNELTPYTTVVMTRHDLKERRREMRRGHTEMSLPGNAVKYTASFPFEPWMNGAEVILKREYGHCNHTNNTFTCDFATLYNPLAPQVVFIEPDVETVKARADKMTAHITFRQDHYDINPKVADNARELERIYSFTDKVMNDKDVKVTGIELLGYASPEGTYTYNDNLSKKRVNALADVLKKRYGIEQRNIRTSNVPEDWDGVSRWVAASNLRYKAEVLDIISSTKDPDARDAKIRALDKGVTYNRLLNEAYPPLRRTEYTIQYTVEPFTVEKGLVVIKTNPHYLSLHEFYQIANTYPVDSEDYRRVYETAVTYFPNDCVANNNMAAIALRNGDTATAHKYLDKCGDYDKTLNNRGVLKVMEGHYDEAERLFRRAAEQGSSEAKYNLENLRTFGFRE